jgi:hypothetical protein
MDPKSPGESEGHADVRQDGPGPPTSSTSSTEPLGYPDALEVTGVPSTTRTAKSSVRSLLRNRSFEAPNDGILDSIEEWRRGVVAQTRADELHKVIAYTASS